MTGKFLVLQGVLIPLICGCPVSQSLPGHAPVLNPTERKTGCPYLLYVPSTFTGDHPYPLVIACHGTWPYDTARTQMGEWAKFAEYEGIIVAAPKLVSCKGDFPPHPKRQIELQNDDELSILAIVEELKQRYNIIDSQVFLTGWSAGAYPILHTGLKHPDIFRALFIRQGTFDERFMDIPDSRIDKWQQIRVVYGKSDFLRDQTVACIRWLEDRGLFVSREEIPGIHRRIDPRHTWTFFKKVVKERPWIRIQTQRIGRQQPLTIRFAYNAVPPAGEQKWFFGDGTESYDASPEHTFSKPGRYEVRLNVALNGGKTYSRAKTIRVSR
ncbi:MAG: PKD domain-containing protein [Phycisphaerae bacterium]